MRLVVILAVTVSACAAPSPPPRLFFTCGDPVCRGYSRANDLPLCTAEQRAGEACAIEGQACDPADECNRRLLCSREDPTRHFGGCPI